MHAATQHKRQVVVEVQQVADAHTYHTRSQPLTPCSSRPHSMQQVHRLSCPLHTHTSHTNRSLGGDVAINSGSTATVVEKDLKAGAAMFNVVDNLLLPPDELTAVRKQT